jgi:hypothetical protein
MMSFVGKKLKRYMMKIWRYRFLLCRSLRTGDIFGHVLDNARAGINKDIVSTAATDSYFD